MINIINFYLDSATNLIVNDIMSLLTCLKIISSAIVWSSSLRACLADISYRSSSLCRLQIFQIKVYTLVGLLRQVDNWKNNFSEATPVVGRQQTRFAQLNKEFLNLSYLSSHTESNFVECLVKVRKFFDEVTKHFSKHNVGTDMNISSEIWTIPYCVQRPAMSTILNEQRLQVQVLQSNTILVFVGMWNLIFLK